MSEAAKNNFEEVKKLLSEGANPNLFEMDEYNSLHFANNGPRKDPRITKLLISYGADVNKKNIFQDTPLHLASAHGLDENSEVLILQGANINVQDENGQTPLHLAALNGHEKICRILIENGANPNVENCEFETASDLAKSKDLPIEKQNRIVQLLSEGGKKFE